MRQRAVARAMEGREMADQMPEYHHESARAYDDRSAEVIAFVCAVLLGAGIVALFLFITWLAYATN